MFRAASLPYAGDREGSPPSGRKVFAEARYTPGAADASSLLFHF